MSDNKEILSGPSNLVVVQSRALVFNSKNEILLVSKDGTRWSTPGGTMDKNEELAKLATNEVYEETGLKVSSKYVAYWGNEEWKVTKGFWYFNEHVSYPFNAICFVFCYMCEIEGSEELDPNWEDLGHGVIKYKKFFTESEFINIANDGKLSQDELVGLNFEQIKSLKDENVLIKKYGETRYTVHS